MPLTSGDEIVRLEAAEYERARTALTRAFLDYELMVYAAPDARRRKSGVGALYGAILKDCFCWGEVHVTRDGTGAACWLPPETAQMSLWRQIRAGMLRLPFCFGLASFGRLLPYDAMTQKLHHQHAGVPHWYLAAIGVEPERQGQGVGGALNAADPGSGRREKSRLLSGDASRA